jgi:hypothetical protein
MERAHQRCLEIDHMIGELHQYSVVAVGRARIEAYDVHARCNLNW